MALTTAGTSGSRPLTQRTVARLCSNETIALATPATLWAASVTCRAQPLQVIPVTASSVWAVRPLPVPAGGLGCIVFTRLASKIPVDPGWTTCLSCATKHQNEFVPIYICVVAPGPGRDLDVVSGSVRD